MVNKIKVGKLKKSILGLVIVLSACSQRPDVTFGIQSTDLANTNSVTEAEYANTDKVDTRRLDVRVDYSILHGSYRYENIRSGGTDEVPSLINTDHNWLGVGVHTKLGSSITYHKDLSHKLWSVEVGGKYRIKPKISIIGGIFHMDKDGGTIFKSGGRRTTGVKVGLQYDLTKNTSLNTIYESMNNGKATIEDRLMTGVEFKF